MRQKHSILLVDDDIEYLKSMKKFLERSGYAATIVADGLEALEAIDEKMFDLILSDFRMPSLDGMELMKEIRRKKLDMPVVFITGYGEVESYMDLMNLGAFDYLNKPVDMNEILRIVRRVFETTSEGCRLPCS